MSWWEANGASDEWYTPKYIFDALGCEFDLDVAAPEHGSHVPAARRLFRPQWDGLTAEWHGFVWMNPPYGGRNALRPWLDKFMVHADGIALVPDRTSAPWWQTAAEGVEAILFVAGKIKFERPDGSCGNSPSNGTTLFGLGAAAEAALMTAAEAGLGLLVFP